MEEEDIKREEEEEGWARGTFCEVHALDRRSSRHLCDGGELRHSSDMKM